MSAGKAQTKDPSVSDVDALGAVMDAEGHFHLTDAPIDISKYRFED